MGDPISEEALSLLDGHIVLSAELAASGHFPAIDILESRSRVMDGICGDAQRAQAGRVRQWMAAYQKSELLIKLGEYRAGADRELDEAVDKQAEIRAFLRQPVRQAASRDETLAGLAQLATVSPGGD
jgi:ATP synthase in type III secretion protein N